MDCSEYNIIHREIVPFSLGSGIFTERVTFDIPEEMFETDDTVQDFVLYVSVNSKGCENWPTASQCRGGDQRLNNGSAQLGVIPDFLQNTGNTRILWMQISLLDNG